MIKHLTAIELGGIAARGGSLEIFGPAFTAIELGSIAARLTPGAHIKVCGSAHLTAIEMGGIAARMPGQVIFE